MHAIAAKAVCFGEALKPEFKDYARRVVDNARAMAGRLTQRGLRLTTGGTDNHLMLVDLRPLGLKGRQVQAAADRVGITLNSNAIPYDEASKFNPSGVRLGSPSVTTRGMGEAEMVEIADCLADFLEALAAERGEAALDAIRERTLDLSHRFPLPYGLR
jgi:glycine hydroxymethyltransferase